MICPIPNCGKDILPKGLPTGLQELLAMRIHLAKNHGIKGVGTDIVAIMRAKHEDSKAEPKGTVFIDVDRNERWL